MALNEALNFILSPFLKMPILLAIAALSLIISLATTFVYKFTTNQNIMKQLRDEIKDLQKSAKAIRNEPAKAMEAQKKAMETNMKYMSHSLKPMIITLIPALLIINWGNANFAFEPIMPGQDFSITVLFEKNAHGTIAINAPEGIKVDGAKQKNIQDGKISWVLNGKKEGEYLIELNYNGEAYNKDVLITNKREYASQIKKIKNSLVKEIRIDYNKKNLINLFVFGWKLGWLGTYILFSIIFTMILRKLVKVY